MSCESGAENTASSCLPSLLKCIMLQRSLTTWSSIKQHKGPCKYYWVWLKKNKTKHVFGQNLVISQEIILIASKCCCVGCKVLQAFAGLQWLGLLVPFIMMASSEDPWDQSSWNSVSWPLFSKVIHQVVSTSALHPPFMQGPPTLPTQSFWFIGWG